VFTSEIASLSVTLKGDGRLLVDLHIADRIDRHHYSCSSKSPGAPGLVHWSPVNAQLAFQYIVWMQFGPDSFAVAENQENSAFQLLKDTLSGQFQSSFWVAFHYHAAPKSAK
jgi:hypothetical protein